MRFTVNLATRDYRRQRLARRIINGTAGFAVVIACILLPGLVRDASSLWQTRGELAAVKQKLPAVAGMSDTDYKALLQEIRQANQLIERKRADWLGLLSILEETVPEGVAIISIDPDQKSGILKISGEARNNRLLQEFFGNLGNHRRMQSVALAEQKETEPAKGHQLMQFTIRCRYGALP